MKTSRIVSFAIAVLISQFALAKVPYNNEVFGKLEGTLDFCAQLDAPSSAKYQERKKQLAKDATEAELAEARDSEDYKKSYNWISEELPKAPKDDALKACKAAQEAKY
jgi:hypothetical protein